MLSEGAAARTRPNDIGMHRVAFAVDDIDDALVIAARHGCFPLRGVARQGITVGQVGPGAR